MIERKFVAQKLKEKQIQDFIASFLSKSGQSRVEIKRTPLGDKIIVFTSRPGLIVGKKGENIKELTRVLRDKFKMENPQIEIGEVENPLLDANSVADQIAYTLERYGPRRFKFLGYENLKRIMAAGALGAEIVIGGRGVPSTRSRSWKFSAGYLKKSGDISENYVLKANVAAYLKSGAIGVRVSILPPSVELPDKIKFASDEVDEEIKVEEIDGVKVDMKEEKEVLAAEVEVKEEEKKVKKVKKKAKRKVKKKVKKKEEKKGEEKENNGDNKEK